jgi:hypothetical protein
MGLLISIYENNSPFWIKTLNITIMVDNNIIIWQRRRVRRKKRRSSKKGRVLNKHSSNRRSKSSIINPLLIHLLS